MRKLTTEEFAKRATNVHGGKYDYSKVDYQGNKVKVCIICPIHGEFWQVAGNHLEGSGCPKCSDRYMDTEYFIEKSNKIHDGKYSYEKTKFLNSRSKVIITCPIHGDFLQSPNKHLCGCGCPKCAKRFMNQEYFVEKAVIIHGKKYDYSKSNYVSAKNKVIIICPEHGEFLQTPDDHLFGKGCPKCARESRKVLIFGFGINDTDEITMKSRSYACWRDMLARCYDEKQEEKYGSYKGCIVSERWRHFSDFNRWYDTHYVEGWHLDKDILIKGNKEYGPDTCCFVPPQINTLFVNKKRNRGLYPIGVTINPYKKYEAHCSIKGKPKYIGGFNTPEEAFEAYKVAKEAWIKEVADKWRDKIDPRVYKAMYNWKIEITD